MIPDYLAPTGSLSVPRRGTDVGDDLIDFGMAHAPRAAQHRTYRVIAFAAHMGRPLRLDTFAGSDRVHVTGLLQRGLIRVDGAGLVGPVGDAGRAAG